MCQLIKILKYLDSFKMLSYYVLVPWTYSHCSKGIEVVLTQKLLSTL